MKKSLVFLASAGLLFVTGCKGGTTSGSVPPTSQDKPSASEKKEETISFEKDTYSVNPKDKVVIKENVEGVTYSFQGGTPEGVTLNSKTGEIDFDAFSNPIPEKVYIATYNGKNATTLVKFVRQQEKPVLTFLNVSEYLVDGDAATCSAKTEKGREYAVSYSLKEDISGISINAETGRVSFSSSVADGTRFVVVAESQGETKEKGFVVRKDHIITSDSEVILEKGSKEDAYFALNFNGNTTAEAETERADVKLVVDGVIQEVNGFSYDKQTKTVKLPALYLSTLASGEHNFKVTTKRNTVALSLAIADKIIYNAEDFGSIFEPDYSKETPSFKENSLSGYYALGCNIDLSSYISAKGDWAPIGAYNDGVYDVPFSGTLNGNGYALTGFSSSGMAPVNGLFGRNTGTIKNLKLQGAIATVKSWSGALVGNNSGTIENVILDVSLRNDGQNATGVLCSVNHGQIQNCFSVNGQVKGNLDPSLSWKQSGLLVGLNETDGSIKNCFALGEGQIFGYSNNSEVTTETAGKVFATLEERKAYDYSSLPSRYFMLNENDLPSLKTLSIPHTPGYFEFAALPEYALKGDSIPLSRNIKPEEREAEYNTYVTYSIEGEAYGAKIVDKSLSLAEVSVPKEGATLSIKATLKLDEYGVDITANATILVYDSISGLVISNTEDVIAAGDTIKLTTATTPRSTLEASFTATTSVAWKSCYFTLAGNKLTVKDDCPDGLDIKVTASAIGETAEKTFTVKKLTAVKGSNAIHYGNDASDFAYTIDGISDTISSITMDGKIIQSSEYTLNGNTLSLKKTSITESDVQHTIKVVDSNSNVYRLFATLTSEDKVDEAWLNNCFGADGYKKIDSREDFNKYFAVDGQGHADLVNNRARSAVYALTCDLDFTGVDFHAIGNGLDGSADGGVIFNGQFYGLNHVIKNVTIQKDVSSWCDGFFRQIGGEGIQAIVQDINFENCTISKAGGNFTGVLSAFAGDSAKIRNINAFGCSVVSGDDTPFNHQTALGGLVGKSWSNNIKYCTYNGYNINRVGQKN